MFNINIRQQLWAFTVFVTCAIAVLLWTSESATYFYKIAQNNAVVADTQNVALDSDDSESALSANLTDLDGVSKEKDTEVEKMANTSSWTRGKWIGMEMMMRLGGECDRIFRVIFEGEVRRR